MTAALAALAILNPAAQVALVSCEQRIERGLKSFLDVGSALAEIRDSRLYRLTHATFEDYCRQRWNLSRPRAYEMIGAAEVVSAIADTELPTPSNEGQARALRSVPEPERADVWREAVERTDGKPTAKVVSEIAKERVAPPSPTPTPEPATATTAPVAGSGSTSPEPATEPDPERRLSVVPDPEPERPALTPKQQQIVDDAERARSINHARKIADRLVREVSGLITEIVSGVRYGEPGLITAEMVAGLRAQADRLEQWMEQQ
jgi:hypothetical protein